VLREQGRRIDWLMTDIRLPGAIDGWVVGSEFTLTHPLRPVIYISGVEPDVMGKRATTSVFLQKPVTPKDLVATLNRLRG